MRRSLFSPLWYRVAGERPRLHQDVRVELRHARGERQYLLSDAVGGRQFLLNAAAYALIGRLDGERTVEEAWDELQDEVGDAAPTQGEVIDLLGELTGHGLIHTAGRPAGAAKSAPRNYLAALNPLAFRVPLGDPWKLITRLDVLRRLFFFPGSLLVWFVVMMVALAAALLHFPELAGAAGGTRWMWLAWLVFPPLKALHELAHALAVRQFGGEVHKAGVTVFLLTPAPYVDASDAAGFRSRGQRVVVGAAGVMAELFVAALALAVWIGAQPGLLRDLAYATFFTACVSTLFFNGNPLLRFDAYYVLSDVLDLPNLAQRSAAWWGRFARRVLGLPVAAPDKPLRGETKWLVMYAPASLACRVVLGLGIVLWLGGISILLGVLAGCMIVAGLVKPLVRGLGTVFRESAGGRARLRALAGVGGATALLALLVFAVPLPLTTSAQGVIWLPENAHVRAASAGFVTGLSVADGARVEPGQVLVELADPALAASRERLLARLAHHEAERNGAMLAERRERAEEAAEEIARIEAELAHLQVRLDALAVKSGATGRLVLPRAADMPGSFVERGATLGYVFDRDQVVVRAAVPHSEAALVRDLTQRVRVRLAEAPGQDIDAQPVREVPAASLELPSAALGESGGGPFATDPDDRKGVRLNSPVVLIDLKLAAGDLERVGSRVWVRFEHGSQSLAGQLYRQARSLFLLRFNPSH
ncbi:MAG: PqqD family peptide modification chaperone [Burkholderiales bacterium]|nr:PqqD family peptide modification chaperone [Burkholderiales bacterium]